MAYISTELRRLIAQRAGGCCEYCLLAQEDVPFTFHIEHVIAEKHGGSTTADNLCLSCPVCNYFKGRDLSSIDWDGTGEVTPILNPRKHRWTDHFRLVDAEIEPLSAEGQVTVSLLRLNSGERLVERELLIRLGRYPCGPEDR